MMKTLICFCILWLSFKEVSMAQAPRKFNFHFGGNGYDAGYDVKQTLDNGYIITGSTSSFGQGNTDMYLIKLDSVGHKKFETSFGSYNNEIGKSVVQLLDSSYVVVGYTNSTGFGGYDVFLVKADKYGNLLWQKTIGGSDWDFAYSLNSTSDGGFIIAGTTYSYGYGNADGYVVKTDANGNIAWTQIYGGVNDDEFKSVVQTNDGGYALTGYTKSYNDVDSGDVWVFKLDALGDSIWSKSYGLGKEDFGNKIILLANSDVLIAGGTKSYSPGMVKETLLLQYNTMNGNLNYSYNDPGTNDEYYNSIVEGLNGSFVGCGKTKNPVLGYQALIDVYGIGYTYINFYAFALGSNDELFSVARTKDKGFVCVGSTDGNFPTLQDVLFLKIDSLGAYGTNVTSLNTLSYSNSKIEVFPNPANDVLNLKISKAVSTDNDLNYNLIDVNGRIVLHERITNNEQNVSLLKIMPGLYFLQLFDGINLIQTSKISVVK